MNYKMMGKFISRILLVEGVFMIPALIVGLYYREPNATASMAISIAVIFAAGGILGFFCRNGKSGFYAKDGFVCVSLSWIVMSALGCLPFYISREIPSYVDAVFEMVSGFTTTGASVLTNVEAMSKCLLYWRSFSHWVGGMGVLVFLLAIYSPSEKGGFTMHLLRAESPGPDVGKLVPKIKATTSILYRIYVALTIIDILLLLLGGMPVFDALCTAFGTAGTGGFGIKNDSITSYSPYIQNVTTVFMALFGVNFSCYYLLLVKQFKNVLKDEELRTYVGIMLGAIGLVAINIRDVYPTIEETVRHAAFQVSSIMTTTGFATTDFDQWPALSKTILLILMVIGASAGSTGGGFKCARLLLVFKNLKRNISRTIRPNKVQVIRNNGQVVGEQVLDNANSFMAAYVIIVIFSVLIVSIDNFSIESNLSAVLACFNNIGPGLDIVGPTCAYNLYSDLSKLVLTFDMLAGRLEIFPLLILFSPDCWKRK